MKRSTALRRMIGVVFVASLTPACLFGMAPTTGDGGGGGGANNVTDRCAEVTCAVKGQLCIPETGECGVISCGFTNAPDGYESTCPDGTVCQLNPEGLGYCAPPCSSNSDCVPGVRCDQAYGEVVGGGLCIPDGLSCLDERYEGLCLEGEYCEPGLDECVADAIDCFGRPDESEGECPLVACTFRGDQSDDGAECFLDSGGVGICQYDPTAPPGDRFNGYCAEEGCVDDFDCVRPGAFCNRNDGRCYSDGGCPAGTFYDETDERCKLYLCDSPLSDEGDDECARISELDMKCSAGIFDDGNRGACLFDCNDDPEQCAAVPSDIALTCEPSTGRCVEDDGTDPLCPEKCDAGDVCYAEGCQESTLSMLCEDDSSCSGGEVCMAPPVGNMPARCILPCDDAPCPVGAACGTPNPMGGASICATECSDVGGCPEGFMCGLVGDFTTSVCLPIRSM